MKAERLFKKGVAATAALIILAGATGVSAKEITSGGTPAGTTACAPVSSLSYRGDARVGETGLASIDVSYSTKQCDKTVTQRVAVQMFENATGDVVYDNADAAASSKFTVFGVKVRTSYIVRVSVYNAATGALIGSQTIFAAAIPKGV